MVSSSISRSGCSFISDKAGFPVGLGRRDWRTPTGDFTIAVKEQDPTWDVPLSIQQEMRRDGKAVKTCVPPGPDNSLGKHWLGLSIPRTGIHGTTDREIAHDILRKHEGIAREISR